LEAEGIMAISHGQISSIATSGAKAVVKSFADRMAEKLRAKAAAIQEHKAATTLNDMADVFETEGWNV
jgi:predicted component of type VI protein secretion system